MSCNGGENGIQIYASGCCQKLLEEYQVRDIYRFQVGVILPDVYNSPVEQENSHFKETVCEGMKRTYNLTKLRELFEKKMKTDDIS